MTCSQFASCVGEVFNISLHVPALSVEEIGRVMRSLEVFHESDIPMAVDALTTQCSRTVPIKRLLLWIEMAKQVRVVLPALQARCLVLTMYVFLPVTFLVFLCLFLLSSLHCHSRPHPPCLFCCTAGIEAWSKDSAREMARDTERFGIMIATQTSCT